MKKNWKLLALPLVLAMAATTFAACTKPGGKTSEPESKNESVKDPAAEISFDEKAYDAALGDFYTAYAAAKNENSDVAKRYALMAIAEAKMLESGVMMPLQADGGNYAISKVAPYTVPNVGWGNDAKRFHNVVVATELIKNEDRNALKALWAEKKGTGTYEAEAKAYLAAHGYTLQKSYSLVYTGDPETYDPFWTQNATDGEVLINTFDSLYEYDCEGVLQPALATSYTVSDDGLTYTFTIREGVKWVDSTGAEISNVSAKDFVTGFQHMLDDPQQNLSWLVDGVVEGVSDYNGDMTEVGVTASEDGKTLTYKLEQPCSYFMTMLGYSVFAPLCTDYFLGKGGKLGEDADQGDYGKDKDSIAYCGPYIISKAISETSFTFDKNAKYWNVDNINIDQINWIYSDGKPATKAYDFYKEGKVDGCGLNTAALAKVKADGLFDDYAYVASTGVFSYPGFLNVYRRGYANYNDATALVTKLSDADKEKTNVATQNQNFRLALTMAIDRADYKAKSVGEELKLTSLVNSYTPGTFVMLPAETTVKINGVDKTYPAGTWYGAIMQDQIDADGYPMKVFDKDADNGVGSSGGYDGWYNVEKAREYLAKAIEEMGIEVTAENPIYIEYPYQDDGDVLTAAANSIKASVEASLEGKVVIVLNGTTDRVQQLRAAYYFTKGSQANYNLSTTSGWGPDYGDPATYLDTMIKNGGTMLKCIGLEA